MLENSGQAGYVRGGRRVGDISGVGGVKSDLAQEAALALGSSHPIATHLGSCTYSIWLNFGGVFSALQHIPELEMCILHIFIIRMVIKRCLAKSRKMFWHVCKCKQILLTL